MTSPKVEPISKNLKLGEGPHWDEAQQALYFVDILGESIHRYLPETGKETSVEIGGGAVTIVVPVEGQKDKFIISRGLELVLLTWNGLDNKPTSLQTIATVNEGAGKEDNRINDGKADPTGRLWAGTMGPETTPGVVDPTRGCLFSLTEKKSIKTAVTSIGISNGLTWSLDSRTMYYIDTVTRKVEAFDFDKDTGDIKNRRTVFDLKETNTDGLPDGMTIDTEGKLWVACFSGSQVIRVDPATGKLMRSVKLPTSQVTSVTFGGPELSDLYVTTATPGLNEAQLRQQPLAGATFKITGLGVKGFPGQTAKYTI